MNADIESRIRETGYRLYDLMEGESGSIFSKEYWVGKLFGWCMHNEAFKVQMLRFIDVFPYLKGADAVISHIQQYFSDPALNFPSAVNWGIKIRCSFLDDLQDHCRGDRKKHRQSGQAVHCRGFCARQSARA